MITAQVITGAPSLALSAHLICVHGFKVWPVALLPFIVGSFAVFSIFEQRTLERQERERQARRLARAKR